MKTRKVNRYYCIHCLKLCSESHIIKHADQIKIIKEVIHQVSEQNSNGYPHKERKSDRLSAFEYADLEY